MNHKKIGIIFAILFALCVLPMPFTAGAQSYLFGWLPVGLAYWWVLMVANLIFVLWVGKVFVKSSEKEENEE